MKNKFLTFILFWVIASWLIYVIWSAWQPKYVGINGHGYIKYPGMYDTKLIHDPECVKCKK